MDGSSRQTGARVGLQLRAPIGEILKHSIRLYFPVSHNETKYEAILAGVDITKSISS